MKKNFLYVLVTFLVSTVSANAQKIMHDDYFYAIPTSLTYDHKLYVSLRDRIKEDEVKAYLIYDMNLNLVETVHIGDNCSPLDIDLYIDKNGIDLDVYKEDIYLTQIFFNEDADWEYFEPVYEAYENDWGSISRRIVSYSVKKADGTVIGSIPGEIEIDGLSAEWTKDIFLINEVVYTTVRVKVDNYDYKYYFYTLPEFRKFITGNANDVKAVPAMVRAVGKEAYDLSGRKALDNQKGIIIKENKKILVK